MLKDKSKTMIIVGYHTVGSYKLYNHLTNNIVTSRHVTINENELQNSHSQDVASSLIVPFVFHDDQNEPHILGRGVAYVEQEYPRGLDSQLKVYKNMMSFLTR